MIAGARLWLARHLRLTGHVFAWAQGKIHWDSTRGFAQ